MKNTNTCPDYRRALRSPVSLLTTRLALLVVFWAFATGCVAPKRAIFVVPRRCLKIDAQSFTRPCVQRADGKLLCDGVVVTTTCIQVSR
jgi:hypothetical protein